MLTCGSPSCSAPLPAGFGAFCSCRKLQPHHSAFGREGSVCFAGRPVAASDPCFLCCPGAVRHQRGSCCGIRCRGDEMQIGLGGLVPWRSSWGVLYAGHLLRGCCWSSSAWCLQDRSLPSTLKTRRTVAKWCQICRKKLQNAQLRDKRCGSLQLFQLSPPLSGCAAWDGGLGSGAGFWGVPSCGALIRIRGVSAARIQSRA